MLKHWMLSNMAMKAAIAVFLFLSLFGLNTSIYRQHYYVNQWKKWPEAQKYCKDNYDDLSTVRNEELQGLPSKLGILFSYYWTKNPDFCWIGLERDSQNRTKWKWTGGEDATDVSWATGEPNSESEKCGAVCVPDFKVCDLNCDQEKPFYCMKLSSKLIVVQQESTWEEALEHCRQNYKELAVLKSEEDMTEARDQSTTALTDDVWISLRFITGQWFWANGEDYIYKAWSSNGELQCPAMDQRCAVLDRNSMVWKPMDCEKKLSFLCVKP